MPREAADIPALAAFKDMLDKPLSYLVYWEVALSIVADGVGTGCSLGSCPTS